MQATVTIDEALLQQALALAEPGTNKAELLRQALEVFVRSQAAKHLAALGGAAPDMPEIARRQTAEPQP